MAKENKTDYNQVRRYDLARAGMYFLRQKNVLGARRSLDGLVTNMALKNHDDVEGLLRGTEASEQGISVATQIYAQKSEERRAGLKLSELPDFYSAQVSRYVSGDDVAKLKKLFGEYKETYGDYKKKLLKANTVLEKREAFTKREIEEAEETGRKYEKISFVLQAFEGNELDSMVNPVQDGMIKEGIKELLKGIENR